MANESKRSRNFIEELIDADNRVQKWGTWPGTDVPRVHTRFPPEPNGYLHIGHAKSICLNFGLAQRYGGKCNLRFDDTNPVKEEQEYIDAIIRDVRWLGFDWEERLFFASDYFTQMYDWAVELIKKGKAFVCDLSPEQVAEHRGTLTRPGRESPCRGRSVDENLELFERMRRGEFPDGSRTLRAKIDVAHPNMNMRDPVMYRILHARHPRTGDKWCIYPMYDWAHGLEDAIEGITHSICTLEFEDHRPLYDWFLDAINEGRGPGSPWGPAVHHPQQIEFARLELTHTVMSKRRLLELVTGGLVRAWDDPRMPTISGMRRRGCSPQAIRAFCELIGVSKFHSTIDVALLAHCIRDDLNRRAPRRMAVLHPLKIVIENYPNGRVEDLDAVNNPEDPSAGTRQVPFSRELYIEQDDFREDPPRQFFRLAPGREVRLRYAYFITCRQAIKDEKGNVVALRCTYDPATRGGDAPDRRKVKATLHWVAAAHALKAEIRLYDHLFAGLDPDDLSGAAERSSEIPDPPDWKSNLNPNSLEILSECFIEPGLRSARPGEDFQFERLGYFCVDPDSAEQRLVFNRTVTLKDTWAKIEKKTRTSRP